jgi:PBP1b-binding outer membrane lipoprotein LpoB
MRALAIIALAMLLAGCSNGDRMRQDSNTRQAQPQSWSPFHTQDAQ